MQGESDARKEFGKGAMALEVYGEFSGNKNALRKISY